jgi:ABC-2 type transport system permease protein
MTAVLTPATTRPAPPSALSIGLARTALELRLFVRDPAQVVFSFAYPIVMLVIFASVRTAVIGIMLTSFQAVGTALAEERERGDLARLQVIGTPPLGYFLGKAGQVLVTTVLQLALLLTVAAAAYDVPMPDGAGRWLTFAWVALGGALAGTVLGIAVASAGSSRAVGNGISAFAVVLQFFSGVFFVFSDLPSWMQEVAAVFPLKWMVQGMRSVFLPDAAAAAEPAGSWEHGMIALVLTVWVVVGLAVCSRTFRWRRAA